MAETPTVQNWIGQAVFIGLCFVIIFFQLLPLDVRPRTLPWPDLLLCVTLIWVARRPDYASVIAIAALFFVTDLLFQRPPGLWSALVLILTEVIRKRANGLRGAPWLFEWGTIAMGIVSITLLNRLILIIALTDTPPLGITLLQMLMTIAAYPAVAIIAHFIFGVSRPAPGAVNTYGHRL